MVKKRRKILLVVTLSLFCVIIFSALSIALLFEPRFKVSAFAELDTARLCGSDKTLRFIDRNGEEVFAPLTAGGQIFTAFDDLPEYTVNAFIAIEDKRFYSHSGVDYLRIISAAKNNLGSGTFKEGASTISQQLIKNTHLNSEKTISRKIQEIRIARDLERLYSKQQIMEMYLNAIYFGANLYGIGTAAQAYFSKPVQALTVAESALLAGIINNPAKHNPFEHADAAIARRNTVLKRMYEQDFLDGESYHAAVAEPLHIAERATTNQYLLHAATEAAALMHQTRQEIYQNGYTVQICLSNKIQRFCETLAVEALDKQSGDFEILFLENESGDFLACANNSHRDLSEINRQPGSTIKPFIAYAPAFEHRLVAPATPILDEKTDFNGYEPANFKDKYYGWTDIKSTLSQSLNVPAVKLLDAVGVERGKQVARRFGIDFHEHDKSLALALGGMYEGVTLPTLSNAYRTLANGGTYSNAGFVRSIFDKNGNRTYLRDENVKKHNVIQEDTAYLITDALIECVASGTGRRLKGTTGQVAAKTGTVGGKDGNTDAYCIAYTPKYTVAVWAGSRDNILDNAISGGGLPAKTAKKVIEHLSDTTKFVVPPSVVYRNIDAEAYEKDHKLLLLNGNLYEKNGLKRLFSVRNLPLSYVRPHTFTEKHTELDDFNRFSIV